MKKKKNKIVHQLDGLAAVQQARSRAGSVTAHACTAVLPMQIVITKVIVLVLDTPWRMPSNPSLAVVGRCNPLQL